MSFDHTFGLFVVILASPFWIFMTTNEEYLISRVEEAQILLLEHMKTKTRPGYMARSRSLPPDSPISINFQISLFYRLQEDDGDGVRDPGVDVGQCGDEGASEDASGAFLP